jgi:heat shock protein HslJ
MAISSTIALELGCKPAVEVPGRGKIDADSTRRQELPGMKAGEIMELAGTAWTLVAFETEDGVVPAVPAAPATLEFSAESEQSGKVSGTGGCNRYFASFSRSGDHLGIGQAGSTRMMCSPERMEQEDRYLQALQVVTWCELRDGELLLTYAGGILRFAPA